MEAHLCSVTVTSALSALGKSCRSGTNKDQFKHYSQHIRVLDFDKSFTVGNALVVGS